MAACQYDSMTAWQYDCMVLNSVCPARHLVLLITHNNDRETKAARGGLAEAAGGGAGGQ